MVKKVIKIVNKKVIKIVNKKGQNLLLFRNKLLGIYHCFSKKWYCEGSILPNMSLVCFLSSD